MKSQRKSLKSRQESRSHDRALRSKIESETAKDLTELEKEMFSIKIADLEEKLNRKKQLCTFLEEEKQFFEAEFESKKILKRESMALLDKAYEDFSMELLLLRNELSRMKEEKSLKRRENVPLTKKVERLTNLEARLKEKLQESERNIEDISQLNSKLSVLEEQIASKSNDFQSNISNLDLEFQTFVIRLKDNLKEVVEKIIDDKSLKLHLLPLPYQALFQSGMLGSTWFETILEICEHLVKQNRDMNGDMEKLVSQYKEVCEVSSKDYSAIVLSNQISKLINDATAEKLSFNLSKFEPQMKYLLELNHLSIKLKNKVDHLENKIQTLEMKIKQQEEISETYDEDYHLQQVISQAKDILTKEL